MCNGVSVKRWKSFMSHYCYKIGIWKNLKRTLLANEKYNLIFPLPKSYEQSSSSCFIFKKCIYVVKTSQLAGIPLKITPMVGSQLADLTAKRLQTAFS